jgi:hypothetical protein
MVKPLTKRQKDGKLYARRASVEASVEVAQTQDLEMLRSRCRLRTAARPSTSRLKCWSI